MQRAESGEKTGAKQRLRAVREELVYREMIYALVCEKEDNRVVKGLEMTE